MYKHSAYKILDQLSSNRFLWKTKKISGTIDVRSKKVSLYIFLFFFKVKLVLQVNICSKCEAEQNYMSCAVQPATYNWPSKFYSNLRISILIYYNNFLTFNVHLF